MQESKSQDNFELKQQIEKKISEKWGYNLDNEAYSPPKNNTHNKANLIVNERIKPLCMRDHLAKPSEKLKQLINEMEQFEIEKKINKMTELSNEGLNIQELIKSKIREHNEVIDHKHLMKRKSNRSIMEGVRNMKTTSCESENILEKIINKQKEIRKGNKSLESQIESNVQINSMFKNYSVSMRFTSKPHKVYSVRKQLQLSIELPKYARIRSFPEIEDIKKKFSHKENEDKEFTLETLERPYVSEKFMQNCKEINDQKERNRHIENVMRHRIGQYSVTKKINKSTQAMEKCRYETAQSNLETSICKDIEKIKEAKEVNELAKISKTEQKKTEGLIEKKLNFSIGLRRNNNRSLKYEKERIIKFESINRSANLTTLESKSPQSSCSSASKKTLKFYSKKLIVPENLTESEEMVVDMMMEENDDEYYESSRLNERVNLLMRSRKV